MGNATEPIRKQSDLRALADYFLGRRQYRNYAMVVLGTCTALRVGDLLNIQWSDIYDEARGCFYRHINITERKTGKRKTIALNEQAIDALRLYQPHAYGNFLFTSQKGKVSPISRVQAWRIIRNAAVKIGLEGPIGCHSLRKTWGYHAWASGQVSPVVICEVYQHSSYNTTRRYLGIAQDDLDEAYTKMELF